MNRPQYMEHQNESRDRSDRARREESPRRVVVWMEWSWRLFIATWPGMFALIAGFLVWVATSIFRHEQRISELERGAPRDLERLKLQILSEVETRAGIRFDAVLAEIRELQKVVIALKVRDDLEREERKASK